MEVEVEIEIEEVDKVRTKAKELEEIELDGNRIEMETIYTTVKKHKHHQREGHFPISFQFL